MVPPNGSNLGLLSIRCGCQPHSRNWLLIRSSVSPAGACHRRIKLSTPGGTRDRTKPPSFVISAARPTTFVCSGVMELASQPWECACRSPLESFSSPCGDTTEASVRRDGGPRTCHQDRMDDALTSHLQSVGNRAGFRCSPYHRPQSEPFSSAPPFYGLHTDRGNWAIVPWCYLLPRIAPGPCRIGLGS